MKDIQGITLKVGQRVAFITNVTRSHSRLDLGVITKINKVTVYVSSDVLDGPKVKTPDKVVVLSNKEQETNGN